jgi:hypothetical protein
MLIGLTLLDDVDEMNSGGGGGDRRQQLWTTAEAADNYCNICFSWQGWDAAALDV